VRHRYLPVFAITGACLAAWAPPAPAGVTAAARSSAAGGPAPFTTTLDASASTSDAAGGIVSYAWTLGDGAGASGAVVRHTYATPGVYSATVTVSDAAGATAQASLRIVSSQAGGLTLAAPADPVTYGQGAALGGVLTPTLAGQVVRVEGQRGSRWITLATARTRGDGSWNVLLRARQPQLVRARWSGRADPVRGAVSPPSLLAVRPDLRLLDASATVYGAVDVAGSVSPARPGERVTVAVTRAGVAVGSQSVRLRAGRRFRAAFPARGRGRYEISVELADDGSYAASTAAQRVRALYPDLAAGATGPAVALLRQRLRALGYRQAEGGSSYGADLVDAVIAFQKVQRLARTGAAGPDVWRALDAPRAPLVRHPEQGDHLEIDKGLQVLLVVRGGRSRWILPVSTGAPGKFTPVGTFAIERKVPGFDPSPLGTLFDPMYFTGGYAVHGNPSVPAYPASHGCVRVPMWAASWLYADNPIGEPVDIAA
jgi:PKD repeat protein